jgi:hypothetical protein
VIWRGASAGRATETSDPVSGDDDDEVITRMRPYWIMARLDLVSGMDAMMSTRERNE